MAIKQEQTFHLRLLVDKERNRVVVAEASGDFIDTLFSFLTLPLGTIIRLLYKKQLHDQTEEIGCINNLYRLLSKKQLHDQTEDIGCINNLYHSVENSSDEVFWNHICKQMLLFPRNNCQPLCQKLKLNVDDTEPLRCFICSSRCRQGRDWLVSTFAGASCCSCGELMNDEIRLLGDSSEETRGDGVFVKRETMYLVFDDLKVLQSSPSNFVKELVQLGYKNFNKLTEMSPDVGFKEILDLLKQALTSKSPLSDVFLENGESKGMYTTSSPKNELRSLSAPHITIKLTVRKSKKKILYAEAEGNFVDFLFSFLTAPLGSILKLLDGNLSLGCMDNLYENVKGHNPSWFICPSGTRLLDPRVAPQFGFMEQPIQLYEGDPPTGHRRVKLFDPRSPDGTRENAVGFVRRPSRFVVWDDLQVTPLASTCCISFMQKMTVPLDDLEGHVVGIGVAEALNLLGASLTSDAALTEGLFYLLKKPNDDAKA